MIYLIENMKMSAQVHFPIHKYLKNTKNRSTYSCGLLLDAHL